MPWSEATSADPRLIIIIIAPFQATGLIVEMHVCGHIKSTSITYNISLLPPPDNIKKTISRLPPPLYLIQYREEPSYLPATS